MLDTDTDYVAEARRVMQDTASVVRYPDNDYVAALGIALQQAAQIRPDLFFARSVPSIGYGPVAGTAIDFDARFRPALVFYMVGYMLMREDEGGNEQKAAGMFATFTSQLGAAK